MSEMVLRGLRQFHMMAEDHPALAASGILMAGHMHAFASPHKRPMDTAGHRLLHLTVAGAGEGWVNGRWVGLPRGTAYIVPPGAEWTWRYRPETSKRWEMLFVDLQPEFRLASTPAHDAAYVRRDCGTTDLRWTFDRLYRESLAKARPTMMAALLEIIACVVRELLDEEEHHYQLFDLWTTVARELDRPWDVGALCDEVAMSAEKLRLLCHKETGRSPMAQVTYIRMRHAADLLIEGSLGVRQIANQVGYGNTFNFSSAFKRHYGVSPTHYRKSKQAPR